MGDEKRDKPRPPEKKQPHYTGHRQRLRERFMRAGSDGLQDYELLELILFRALPRRDVKPLAKSLLETFGSFAEVISASPGRLSETAGLGESAIIELKIVEATAVKLAQGRVAGREVVTSWSALLDYCQASMAYNKIEQFRILFLDHHNKLIADEIQQRGTVNHTPVYPREVVKRALEHEASAIVLVHNHPSGDPTPSRADIDMTRQIVDAAKPMKIAVHDHLIIGKGTHTSFKALGLI